MAQYTYLLQTGDTVQDGVNNLLLSGLMDVDIAILSVPYATYNEEVVVDFLSGIFKFQGYYDYYPTVQKVSTYSSGVVHFENMVINQLECFGSGLYYTNGVLVSGLISGIVAGTLDKVDLLSGLIVESGNYFSLKEITATGYPSSINVYDMLETQIYSGVFASGISKIGVINCSYLNLERAYGYNYDGYPIIRLTNVTDFDITHCSFVNFASGILSVASSSGWINYSILASSGAAGVSAWPVEATSSIIMASGSDIVNYLHPGTGCAFISGDMFHLDPQFVDPINGDLTLNVNSSCGCRAEYIYTNVSGTYVNTLVTPESIQFYVAGQGFKAQRPSGIYVVQDGKAIFFCSGSHMREDIEAIINYQYTIEAYLPTYQSLSTDKASMKSYPKDYRIISRMIDGKIEYFVEPYTVIPLDYLYNTVSDSLQRVSVSGDFLSCGVAIEHQKLPDGIPCYWILEENEDAIYRYNSSNHELISKYNLFTNTPLSGYASITLDSESVMAKTVGGIVIRTNKFFDGVTLTEKVIETYGEAPTFRILSYEKDSRMDAKAIVSNGDYLYIVTRNLNNDGGVESVKFTVNAFNKFESYPFEEADVIMGISGIISYSGGQGDLDNLNIRDVTVDDEGQIYLAASGTIFKLRPYYDYGFVQRIPRTSNSTIYFREKYEGVKI